jgi:hypothetical protein
VSRWRDATSALTWATSVTAVALTLHSLVNARLLRTPPPVRGESVAGGCVAPERISVLVPMRDEALRLEPGLRSVLSAVSRYGAQAELVVLDDGSTDGTRSLVEQVVADAGEPGTRVRVVAGSPPPRGWLGKTWACWQLAEAADPSSTGLVFVDADVRLEPFALRACLDLLRDSGLDLVSPWPRQETGSLAERLVQPLQQWSWLTTVPLHAAERSSRPSLAAANGQLLVVDRAAYDRAGGHASVAGEVLDDIGLLRAVVRSGGHGAPVDGSSLARCRMYEGWADLRAGYRRSLWAAFGSGAGATAVTAALGGVYVWPFVAAVAGSPVGAAGYVAGVLGRMVAARRTGGRPLDAFAHPVSIAVLGWLTADSFRGHRSGTLLWKQRSVVPDR